MFDIFNIDKKIEKLGFKKIYENGYGVSYEREENADSKQSRIKTLQYVQRIEIVHKKSGEHLIMSFQDDLNSDGFNNVVGLTYEETKLAMKKYRQLKRKFKW